MKQPTAKNIQTLWKEKIVGNAKRLDDENDKGGHDWHSLWTGFVVALDRPDLAKRAHYMRLGFPLEASES